MRVFVLSLLISVLGVSAFAQAKSGVEGVWQLTEVTTTNSDAMAMPATAAAAASAAASTEAATKPLAATATMKTTQPSMYLFAKSHYSIIYVAAEKPRMVMEDYEKASKEELLDTFVKQFVANAGTYELKAGKLTLRPTVAKSPGYMKEGTWSAYTINVSGNTMTLVSDSSNSGASKSPITYKLTRVE